MMATDIIVHEFADELIRKLQMNIKNVTGKSAASIFYRWDGKHLVIGSTYGWITVLEDGRPPGKWPPRKEIKSWIEAAGINSDLPTDSLAYLIQRKIGEEGSMLWRQGGKSGVLSDYLNEQYIQENLIAPYRDSVMDVIIDTLLR